MASRIPGYTDPNMTPFQAAPGAYSSFGIHPCENGARVLFHHENLSAGVKAYSYAPKEKIQKKNAKKTVLKLKKDYEAELDNRSEEEHLQREELWKNAYAQKYSAMKKKPAPVEKQLSGKDLQRQELWKERYSSKYQGTKRVESSASSLSSEEQFQREQLWKKMKTQKCKEAAMSTNLYAQQYSMAAYVNSPYMVPQFNGFYCYY